MSNLSEKKPGTVLLFGGTFAPPHCGHVNAVKSAAEHLHPDSIVIMPTAVPPHKVRDSVDTPDVRLEMCRAAFGEIPGCMVSSYEIDKGGVSYTVDTLEYLITQYEKIYLLCGSDMLMTLDRWRKADRIFELASILCMPRYDDDIDSLLAKKKAYEESFGAEVSVIRSDVLVMSSTEVREKIASGESLDGILPDKVAEIIRDSHIFEQIICCCSRPLGNSIVFQSIFHTVAHIQHHFSAFGFGCVASSSIFTTVNFLVNKTGIDVLNYFVSDFGNDIHVVCTSSCL